MPASPSPAHRSLTLSNGLRLVLCSAPRLKRCAAALRVAAGSHDVPPQWPGLAHFLEHLFFLGTARFPAEQNLMTYVQRHGGQVNASTRERTTDFFFELPPGAFAGGLERLCEMLVHPRMTKADQLREREVLHAEFIAWARDIAARDQLKLLQPLSALHPLRWFHAGNRYSLPVPRPAFQQALQDFYRTFYQAGQMTLSLAGPQPLDELHAVAATFGGYFTEGSQVEQLKPPALVDDQLVPQIQTDPRRMHLIFPCEGLPVGHEHAAAFLCTWMHNAQAGGLAAQLRDRELIESFKAEVLYEFAGQALLHIEVVLTENIAYLPTIRPSQTAEIHRLIFSWLTFFKAHHRQLLDEYTLLETRRLAVLSALPLARHYSASTCKSGLSHQAIRALEVLLDTLVPQSLLQAAPQLPKAACADAEWRLPRPNPFLYPSNAHFLQTPAPASLTFSDRMPATDEGTLYLRWTLSTPQPNLHLMLNDSLQTLIADAEQAGVRLAFSAYGDHWQLQVSGLAEPLPAVLEQALNRLSSPDSQTRTRYGQSAIGPASIPIRQLLKTLPDHFLNSLCSAPTDNLHSVWETARWVGFATGIQGASRAALINALRATPGTPDDQPITLPACTTKRWATEPSDSSEQAVLMFYPTPSASIEDEAMWRFFAHVVQGPFYQRLRVELQLGYAVFSGFRQIAGHGGMLFGVQSPNASAMQLAEHITTFMETLPGRVETADIPAQRSVLLSQLDPLTMDTHQAAEMLWQAHLAGHAADYAAHLQHSLAHLHLDELLESARRIARPEAFVFGLSSPP
ncbi:pyrroloquinoline quinone biosynthesis protein PqqF [Pseudomonas sp. LP_7_YM]|uniref:pyrroloquinoline quinone biosynthesis protein PqqF n=1 Tax=Pseudomonas sp. LP_7_YM TaxID=2485137 RepID=UPI00105D4C46|nr:pyrroloquinoline quinone biosynthesis protein PqqF [Pseudomonas sp. LP_7_YM]TDV59561.1 pyrroloquinoline quinone synthesis related protease (pqqF) [Pseudomonas sp. LP_7_YM]